MKPKLLFVYDHNKPEQLKGDGLWSALDLLEKDFEIERCNLLTTGPVELSDYDFVLGWGSFNSQVDKSMQDLRMSKKGLCLSAYMEPNENSSKYDVIFYETETQRKFLDEKGVKTKLVHAFGINTDIFKPLDFPKIWDYITVGSFITHHRYEKLPEKKGFNLVVGEIMTDNIQIAFNYAASGLLNGWMVSNQVNRETLTKLYNMSKKAYLPAEFGQERACLEARACGLDIEIENNPKLKELLASSIWDCQYYAEQLKNGILSC